MKTEDADRIIRAHVLWGMGAGLIPLPLIDIAAVTAIQLDMLKDLAMLYNVDYSTSSGKAFVSAIAGSTLASIGASLIKSIPGIGSIFGGVSMSVMSGASTYAVGQVAAQQFATAGSLTGFDIEVAQQAYKDAFEQGKDYVSAMDKEKKAAESIYESLKKLKDLKEQGILSDEEFEAKKKELLARL